jgi:hypothetical protein
MTRLTRFALASVLLAGLLKAIDLVPPDSPRDDFLAWLFVVAVNVVAAAILFWIIARRSLERPATAALVVAVLGFLSLAFYWVALPAPFVGSAAFLGLEARRRGAQADAGGRGRGTAAIIIAGVTLAAAVLLAAFGE